jgi:rubrerythrin
MDLGDFKDIIKFAMANEVEAQKFYEDAAKRLKDPHLQSMFMQFADEEKKHREILKGIYISNRIGEYFDETRDYHVAEGIDTPELSIDMKPADALALAMKKEEEAMVQYTELAESCPDAAKKKVFQDLAAMERGHKMKMETAFVDIGYPEVW